MNSYRVRIEEWEDHWTLYIHDENEREVGVTQSKHSDADAVYMVRSYLSLVREIPEEEVGEITLFT